MSWESQVIDALYYAKRAGLSFEEAWTAALETWPPSLRQLRGNGIDSSTLFEVDAQGGLQMPEETPVQFLRRVTSDAWHGRRPALGKLMEALDWFDSDYSEAAPRRVRGRGLGGMADVA